MTHIDFLELHTSCTTAMRAYVVEMEKTTTMLAECTPAPLGFKTRFDLMSQGIVENDAHLTYLGAKSLLSDAARLGYGFSGWYLPTESIRETKRESWRAVVRGIFERWE